MDSVHRGFEAAFLRPSAWQRARRIGLAALITASAGCHTVEDHPAPALATIQRGDLTFRATFYGEIEARKSIPIHTPELSGVEFLTVDTVVPDGTEVKPGDPVITFEKGPVEEDVSEKRALLAVAEAEERQVAEQLSQERISLELEVSRKQMATERAELNLVVGVNLISKLELEKAKLDLARAKLDLGLAGRTLASFSKKKRAALEVQQLKVKAARDKYDTLAKALSSMVLRAPAAGVLFGPYTRLNWVRGKAAPGSVTRPGDKLLELPDLRAFNAVLFIRQREEALLKVGDSAQVTAIVRPDVAIAGKVVRKEAFATTRNQRLGTDEPAGNLKEIRVEVELARALPELRPGGTVRADVATVLSKQALLVPLAALVRHKDGSGYQVVMASGEKRTVTLGRSSTTHAEVKTGLTAGESVRLGTRPSPS